MFYEVRVDRCFTEFVLDNSDAESMVSGEYMIQECGLATTEESGNDSDRNHERELLIMNCELEKE